MAALVVALLLTIELPGFWMFTQIRTEPVSVTLAVPALAGRRDSTLRSDVPLTKK